MRNPIAPIAQVAANILIFLSSITLLLLAIHVTANIIARYFFDGSIPATLEIGSYYYMVAVTFLPLAYSQICKTHIAVDFIVEFLPPKPRLFAAIVTDIIILSFLVLFVYAALGSALDNTRRGDYILTQDFDLLLWPSHWFVFAGVTAFAVEVFSQLLDKLIELFCRTSPATDGELA